MHNPFKHKLAAGETTYGVLITLGSTELMELWCTLGLDWLWIDLEHSALSLESANVLMQVMAFSTVTPLVRIPWNEPAMVKRVLDIGAYGVVFPMVNSAAEAEAAVTASKYPARGIRGVGGHRAQRLGLDGEQYRASADDETMVIVQCETAEAVANIAEIAAVPGVDIVFVGPYDLSMSMGLPGQFAHPDFQAALERVLGVCNDAGMPVGILTTPAFDAARCKEMGFRFIAIGVDATVYSRAALGHVEEALGKGS
jgi:4-hydroxy-2-oxoheptanedioate aldolase